MRGISETATFMMQEREQVPLHAFIELVRMTWASCIWLQGASSHCFQTAPTPSSQTAELLQWLRQRGMELAAAWLNQHLRLSS
jgi:hypothetical protein